MTVSPVRLCLVRSRPSAKSHKAFQLIGFAAELQFPFDSLVAGKFIETAKASPPAVRLKKSDRTIICSLASKNFAKSLLTLSEEELAILEPMFDASGKLLADEAIVRVKPGSVYNPVVLFEHQNGVPTPRKRVKQD